MKLSKGLIFFALAALSVAQSRREPERPLKQPVRGVHGGRCEREAREPCDAERPLRARVVGDGSGGQ